MRTTTLPILTATLMLSIAHPAASAATPTEATDVSKADLELLTTLPGPSPDHVARVVDVGKLNVVVAIVHRGPTHDKPGDLPDGDSHDQITEVYHIVSGSGTLTTGGTLVDQRRWPADSDVVREMVGPSWRGKIRGGHARKVSAGDVVIIPPGVLHGWQHIDKEVTYVSIRPDPDRVLQAGYINPALRK